MGMDHRVHVRVVDLVQRGLRAPSWFLFSTGFVASIWIEQAKLPCALMSSSRHVKGGYELLNPLT